MELDSLSNCRNETLLWLKMPKATMTLLVNEEIKNNKTRETRVLSRPAICWVHYVQISPSRYDSDLSIEVLYALAGQEAAKTFEVKVGGQKENCQVCQI